MTTQPTHPGLAHLRALAPVLGGGPDPTAKYRANIAVSWAAEGAWIAAGCPTDLVPESDLRAAERERDEARDAVGRLEDERDTLRETLAVYRADIAGLHVWIERLKAENARLARRPLGLLRAWWGGR